MTWDFTLDTQAPVISNLVVTGEGDARRLPSTSPTAAGGRRCPSPESPTSRHYYDERRPWGANRQADGTYAKHYETWQTSSTARFLRFGDRLPLRVGLGQEPGAPGDRFRTIPTPSCL